jgi:hypothetical protein
VSIAPKREQNWSLPITIMLAQRHVFKRDGPMPPTDQPERSKQDDKRGEHA